MAISAAWEAAITGWICFARRLGAPSTTIRTRSDQLRHLARRLGIADPWAVTGEQLVDWFQEQPWQVETRRGRRTTFRVFYAWAVEAGHVEVSPALALPRVKPAAPRPHPASNEAYRMALSAAGDRERLMLRLSAELGLRRAEVAQVHSRDLIRDLDGWSLVVHGKGGRDRVVPMPRLLSRDLRALPPGWAFPGDDRGHLSPRWVGTLVARLLPDGVTMHALRHRFATRTYEVERDVFVVQELLGHASPATTRAYVLVEHARLRSTVEAAAGA